ncbi:MAG: hypothetical protein ACOYL6_02355 [Bacteriovoracaceae bacterium]
MKDKIFELARAFTAEPHGNSDYDKDEVFVMGEKANIYVPLSFIQKNLKEIATVKDLQALGFNFSSFDFLEEPDFETWYETQFTKKVKIKMGKSMAIMHLPDEAEIFNVVEEAGRVYDKFRDAFIVVNSKNLPVQLGEWYAKNIFGLKQIKSTSQRGFDFKLGDRNVEVKVHWADKSSPKGVKIKKSLIELSDFCIVLYVARNLLIRDICFLDSEYILRKLSDKGHTVFLKDQDIASYFFSRSAKHFDKVVNRNMLMKFSTPQFAMKLDGRF